MRIIERLSRVPKNNEMLEAGRDNIGKNGVFWLVECGRIKLKETSQVGKLLEECRSIPIRFFLARKDDWEQMIEIMKESKRVSSKEEPSLKQIKTSKSTVLTMMILYRYENPFDYDLIVANHQQLVHMMKSHKNAGTNGWSVFCKYIYALHHEVFHSYETYILGKHKMKIDFILPSPLSRPPNVRTRYNDCVLRGLTDDFPQKKHFNTWLKDYAGTDNRI